MSTRSAPVGYSLFDIFTRIVPGLTVFLPLIVLGWILGYQIDMDFRVFVLGFGILGLITGELIDMVRSAVFHVPSPFKQVIFKYTKDESILGRSDQIDLYIEGKLPRWLQSSFYQGDKGRDNIFDLTDMDFRTEFEDQFDLDMDSENIRAVYSTFLSHMDSRMSSRTRRYRMLRDFSQNLMFSSILAMIFSIYLVFQNATPERVATVVFSIIVLFLFIMIALIFSNAVYPLVDLLIIDYYVDKKGEM